MPHSRFMAISNSPWAWLPRPKRSLCRRLYLADKPTAARWPAGLAGAFIAAGLSLSSPAYASCQFPAGSTDTPRGVAKLLLANTDAVGFAVVKQTQDISSKRHEEIEMIFVLKGPQGNLALRNPAIGTSIAMGNAQSSLGAPVGALVFAALMRTRSGWVIGECTSQLLNAFPLTILVPELQREFSSRRR